MRQSTSSCLAALAAPLICLLAFLLWTLPAPVETASSDTKELRLREEVQLQQRRLVTLREEKMPALQTQLRTLQAEFDAMPPQPPNDGTRREELRDWQRRDSELRHGIAKIKGNATIMDGEIEAAARELRKKEGELGRHRKRQENSQKEMQAWRDLWLDALKFCTVMLGVLGAVAFLCRRRPSTNAR